MRTTLRIDDDLMLDLKKQAQKEGLSLTRFVNGVLRKGMAALKQVPQKERRYREKTFVMGEAKVNLDKALAFAAELEDEEICEKLARGK